MKANCVVCGGEFDKRGPQKTCGEVCRTARRSVFQAIRSKKHYIENREVMLERARQHAQANREARLEYWKQYRKTHLLDKREYDRRYQAANRDARREYKKRYRDTNPEYQRRWYENNHEAQIEYYRCRRGILRAANLLGIPPALYVAMKIRDQFQQQESQA